MRIHTIFFRFMWIGHLNMLTVCIPCNGSTDSYMFYFLIYVVMESLIFGGGGYGEGWFGKAQPNSPDILHTHAVVIDLIIFLLVTFAPFTTYMALMQKEFMHEIMSVSNRGGRLQGQWLKMKFHPKIFRSLV